MAPNSWASLPAGLRRQVEQRTGPVLDAAAHGEGLGTDLRAVLTTATGPVFVKGVRTDDPRAWSLRNEAAVSPHMRPLGPRLLWHLAASGWQVCAFEYVAGRYADQRPGSADLPVMIELLRTLGGIPAPPLLQATAGDVWGRYLTGPAAAARLAGNAVVHRDLNPTNFLITPGGRGYLTDWGAAIRGPGWLTPALLILTLAESGWPISNAETAAAQLPAWITAPAEDVSVFADANAAMWQATTPPDPHWSHRYRAGIAAQWAAHRRAAARLPRV